MTFKLGKLNKLVIMMPYNKNKESVYEKIGR